MREFSIRLSLVLLASAGCVETVRGEILYQGSSGTSPGSQGWVYLALPVPAGAKEVVGGGMTTLDTTPKMGDAAGYFTRLLPPFANYVHPLQPVLDRDAGYRIRFDARVKQENHDSDNRAGLSLLVLGDDLLGIELGFWADQVWAQSGADFTKDESAAFDTTDRLAQYELSILDDGYSLSADGIPVLAGSLRDYSSAAGGSDPLRAVYGWDNLIFLGDDTGSASAEFELSYVEVLAGTAVPEPSTALLLVSGGLLFVWRRARMRCSRT